MCAGPVRSFALAGLARVGALPPDDTRRLIEHYRFLRRVSTSLRLLGARPADVLELAGPIPRRVATALDYRSRDGFLADYRRRTSEVRAMYTSICGASSPRPGEIASQVNAPMPTFYIVDGHSHLFRAYHAVGYLSTSKGVPSHAVLILSTMLWKLIREEQPDYLGVAWDPPGPTFRDTLFTEYKATRTSMPNDLVQQLPYVRRLLEALRVPALEVAGFEADDVLATLVERARAPGVEITVVSGDKDLLQLVGPGVRALSVLGRTGERIVYDEGKVRERWGVAPAQIPDVLALMGDAIDNIPGVKGVGEKTAVKLISQFGSVDRLYENLSLVPGKLRETLGHPAPASHAVARAGRTLSRGTAQFRPRSVPPRRTRLDEAARPVDGDGVRAPGQGVAGPEGRDARRARDGPDVARVTRRVAGSVARGGSRGDGVDGNGSAAGPEYAGSRGVSSRRGAGHGRARHRGPRAGLAGPHRA